MDQPRNEHGQYVTLRDFVMSLMDERFAALRRELAQDQKALRLQADEYERRLEDLNHAHARAQSALNTFVSIDKYEDMMAAEESARKLALERFDEKLEDYIKRYEARQREIDQAIAIGEGAAQEAKRAAEEQGRKSNRNMALVTIALTIIIAISNWFGSPTPPTSGPPTIPTVTTTP